MKLQPASRKELSRIAVGTLVCDAVMIAALFLLSLVGVGAFNPFRVLLGAACGSVVAIVNFAILCLTVQSAVEIVNKKIMKARFQLSYNIRLILQAGWVVLCFVLKPIHFVAGAAPILFPNVVIFFLNSRNRLFTQSDTPVRPLAEDAEEPEEDSLGPFEV